MIPHVQIRSVASVLPKTRLTSRELEKQITNKSIVSLPPGIIEMLTGVKERRVADAETNASDLATKAGKVALKRANVAAKDVDCLIFASASGDVMEPATGNIVQYNLGLSCPVFDIKNACNSFLNGIEVAEALIRSGKYETILITNGEIPSRAVRTSVKDKNQLRESFAGYTLGDAGSAMVLTKSDGTSGILFSEFHTYGKYWSQSAVLGGGTRFPRDPDKGYFGGETAGLKDIFVQIGPKQIYHTLEKVGWCMQDIDHIIVHQVSMKTFDLLTNEAKLPKEKLVIVLPELGNMVSASLPVSLDHAMQDGRVKRGEKLLLLGLAAGVSIATFAIIW